MINWKTFPASKEDYYNLLAVYQIKNDCETLKSLIPTLNEPIVVQLILPYLSLFCKSIEEYYNGQGLNILIQNTSSFSLEDTRAKIKLFNEKYGKSKQFIDDIDHIQDTLFKERIKFSSLRKYNIHYNLGVFLDSNKNIIGNTQFMFSLFKSNHPEPSDIAGEDIKKYGQAIGTVIASVSKGLSDFLPDFQPEFRNINFIFSSIDLNTDKDVLFNNNGNLQKAEALLLLHVLGSVNFSLNIIDKIASPHNPWRMRIFYITLYYAYKLICKLSDNVTDRKIEQELKSCLSKIDTMVICPRFRSCMMHYGFVNNGNYEIDDKYFDISLPLYGLVETCFGGASFDSLNERVYHTLKIISDSLSSICAIDTAKAKVMY